MLTYKTYCDRRQEENEVILTGEQALINRLKDQLALEVEQRREIVLGMKVPYEIHRELLREYGIGEVQKTARVLICFPGGKNYHILPEPQNLLDDDLFKADELDIVKIQGTLQACTTARQMLEVMLVMNLNPQIDFSPGPGKERDTATA